MNNIDSKDLIFQNLEEQYELCTMLMQGSKYLQATPATFLPQLPAELSEDYEVRLSQALVHPFFRRSILNGTALVFSDEVEYEASAKMSEFYEDVDLSGRDLTDFTEDCCILAMTYGIAYILTDYTAVNAQSTTTDRPYWGDISPLDVLSIKTKRINGVEELTHFRFMEYIYDDTMESTNALSTSTNNVNGVEADRIRVYNLVNEQVVFEVYQRDTGHNKSWTLVDEGIMEGINRIPVTPVFGQRKSSYIGSPPFYDLAELNLRYIQSYSEQCAALSTNRIAILFGSGFDSEDPITGKTNDFVVSPNMIQTNPNPDARLNRVEGNGVAMGHGETDLINLERHMELVGIGLDRKDISREVTATEMVGQTRQKKLIIKKMARRMEGAIVAASLKVMEYLNDTQIPKITINVEDIDPALQIQPNQHTMKLAGEATKELTEKVDGQQGRTNQFG